MFFAILPNKTRIFCSRLVIRPPLYNKPMCIVPPLIHFFIASIFLLFILFFFHSFIHFFITSIFHLFILYFFHSFIHSFIFSSLESFIYSFFYFFHSFIYSSTHSLVKGAYTFLRDRTMSR